MQTTLVVVAVVAGIGFLLWKLKHFVADEDRPEIVVRNRRLRIQTGKDWEMVSSANKWKPDHANGKSVMEYEVTVQNAKEPQCNTGSLTGTEVKIVIEVNSREETIKLVRERNASSGKHEPVVDSDIVLEHETGNRKTLRIKDDPDASIKKVKVGNNTECTFPNVPGDDVVVKVKIKH